MGLRIAQGSIRYVRPVRPSAARGLVAKYTEATTSSVSAIPALEVWGCGGGYWAGVAARGKRAIEPGGSLALLPDAPVPEDLSWSAGHATVAGAFAKASAVIDSAGARSLPLHVRELVHTLLSGDAVGFGLSRSWVGHAVAELPTGDRAVAKLALLTALASYQVDADVVASARHDCADDAALIDLTAWASLTAARRAVSRYSHASRRPF